ncbi:hypothetical protein EXIGLDRAFT_720380 [Exidia glandulosa HHB12029]|uniref:Uncharacterized protein n=1 Tax=Exidia glandulosa HHB12029 TaxID=1314781 RepID=A0A165GDZ9_EXIGL|nr:hypothetical protein EXIGLDRAFT_720380 [Exidia glandulosa HHB12029]
MKWDMSPASSSEPTVIYPSEAATPADKQRMRNEALILGIAVSFVVLLIVGAIAAGLWRRQRRRQRSRAKTAAGLPHPYQKVEGP